MTDDPVGYYATLDVDPAATPEAITAAFRRKARMVHPDVPGTGDAAAFIRVKQAYDVLGDAYRRAAYDRSARAVVPVSHDAPLEEEPGPRLPRLSDLPIALWAGLGGVFCVAVVVAAVQFNRPHPMPLPPAPAIGLTARAVPAARPRPLAQAPTITGGTTTHYVRPAGDDAVLWLYDVARDTYLPAGRVGAFSPVLALRVVPQHGLLEVSLADGGSGFIDAVRLAPGDRTIARRAYCAYTAGPSPRNGEILRRHGDGTSQVEISNRGSQPVVVKLRDASGHAAATVFVTPGDSAIVANLPETVYRPELATGELWSSACNSFTAGMRAQRFTYYATPSALSPLVIPPRLSAASAPEDISDAAFEKD